MPTLGKPDDLTMPFFTYGLLKPGELAFSRVEPFVTRQDQATAHGTLWLRDGIPLFDSDADRPVDGWLLWFDPAGLDAAWSKVSDFEPATQYRWSVVVAHSGEAEIAANVLEGLAVHDGTAGETKQEWSAGLDPVFAEGLGEVRRLVHEAAPHGVYSGPDTPELWQSFFRLQAAYLLLWSIVERYTALRFGPGLRPMARVRRLQQDKSFREALVRVGAKPGEVVDSRDPEVRYQLTDRPAEYYYNVRSNLSHRGKSAFRDVQLVFKAVTELQKIMGILVDEQVPALKGES